MEHNLALQMVAFVAAPVLFIVGIELLLYTANLAVGTIVDRVRFGRP